MRILSRMPPGVKLDMTPMIDIVFQLLVFFAMTLRVAALEGNLAIELPLGRTSAGPPPRDLLPLVVTLRAGAAGDLREVALNGRPLSDLEQLHREVQSLVGGEPELAAATEAHLACDRDLSYEHTIAALTAVSGTRLPSGELQPLVGKVRFAELR